MNKRFFKKNWKVFTGIAIVIFIAIYAIVSTRLASIEDTRYAAAVKAGLDTEAMQEIDVSNDDQKSTYEFVEDEMIDNKSSIDESTESIESKPTEDGLDNTTTKADTEDGYDIVSDDISSSKKAGSFTEDTVTSAKTGISTGGSDDSDSISDSMRRISDGSQNGKDKYNTDPVPDGKPLPVDEDDQKVNKKNSFTVTLSIDCMTILDNMDKLQRGLEKYVGNGTILPATSVLCYDGETVWDVLNRECKARGIQLESTKTTKYGSVYVEGINNLYEFSCGALSGWCYSVDGWFPNYGCSRYVLTEGESIEWRYTCDLGEDIGCTVGN